MNDRSQEPNRQPSPGERQLIAESLERTLAQFYSLQAEVLRVHQQFIQAQTEYARSFFQLVQEQYAALGLGTPPSPPPAFTAI